MSAVHTPGPWRYDAVSEGTVSARTGARSEMHPAGFSITAVEPRMFGGTRLVEKGIRNEADAALIAAAPDLLAALESAFDMLQECMRNADDDTADTIDEVCIYARAAIIKAVQS